MYDSHHQRISRIYILALLFLLLAASSLVYISPARTMADLEARLTGAVMARTTFEPEYVAALTVPAVVRISSRVHGIVSFPFVSVIEQDGLYTIALSDSNAKIQLPIDNYELEGSGVFVGDGGYIATNAHVVSTEWLYGEIFYRLVGEAIIDNASKEGGVRSWLKVIDLYLDGGLDSIILEALPAFLEKLDADVVHEIRVRGIGQENLGAEHGQLATVAAVYPLASITGQDVALIRADGYEHITVPVARLNKPLAVGSRVYTVGYPLTGEISTESDHNATFGAGVIAAYKKIHEDVFAYQTDVRASVRSSGSPLLNEQGEMVGILTISTSDLTGLGLGDSFVFALRSQMIDELAEDHDIVLRESALSKELYSNIVALQRGNCSGIHPLSLQPGPYTSLAALDDVALCNETVLPAGSIVDRIKARIGQIDEAVLFVFFLLAGFVFMLSILLVYLRSRLLAEEREIGSLKRFVHRMHKG